DRHRVESPDEHRAAVREVVRGRAGRRRTDDPVAGLPAERLAADGPGELDHAPDGGARGDDVVDGGAALAVELELERRQLDDAVVAGEDARELRVELALGDRRQEAHAPEVDADR